MQTPTVRLRRGRLGRIRNAHPWVYKNQILKTSPAPQPGAMISLLGPDGKFIGRGYYNPRSEISVRLLTFKDEPVNKKFLSARIAEAMERRKKLAGKTDAYRIVFSEADSLPGLIADRYNDTVVFQALTLGIDKIKDLLTECIREEVRPRHIYEKSSSE
jgi:23S rRNA (cytosine1962-C5)-methyltransferase